MKLPHPRHGNTIADMAKDDRLRHTRSINFDADLDLLKELDKESEQHAQKSGYPASFGAYVRLLLKTHQDRLKKKKK